MLLLLLPSSPPALPAVPTLIDCAIVAALTVHQAAPSRPIGLSTQTEVDDFNVALVCKPSGTAPVASAYVAYPQVAIGGGGATDIDLTAAQGIDGTIDCSGKRLIALLVDARSGCSGPIAVAAGPANGYTFDGVSVNRGALALLLPLSTGIAVDAAHKIIRASGTSGDTPKLAALFG